MQQPLVSVIIPTYNRITMLQEALQSVFAQDVEGTVEIIVIDDNSSDETCKVVSQKYPEVKLISLNQNQGAGAARNQGLQIAQGQYLAFLDSDDLWETDYLKRQISLLESHDSKCFGVSYILTWDISQNQKQIQQTKPDLKRYTSPLHHMIVGNFIYIASCVVFPRQVLQDVGYFDESIRYGQDAEFYARCLIASYTPILLSHPLAIQRRHPQAQLTDIKNWQQRMESRLYAIQKNYPLILEKGSLNLSQEQLFTEVYKKYARMYIKQGKFIPWLKCLIKIAHYSSLLYALSTMINDLGRCVIKQKRSHSIV